MNTVTSRRILWWDLCWLFLAIGGYYLLWLGSHGAVDPDEGRYSEVAREMLASGNFITPYVDGVIFFDKPILFYWLQAFAFWCFGLNDWSLRFFPMLFGVGTCLLVYLLGQRLFSRSVGIVAALMLAVMPLFFGVAHYANMDMEVAFFITGAIGFTVVALEESRTDIRRRWMWAAFIFAALGFLTKGLIALAFPMLVLGVWILLFRQWRVLARLFLPSGFLLFLGIVLPWFVLVSWYNPTFLQFFFVNQQLMRFVGSQFNGQQPIWFYGYLVAVGMLPWLCFLVQTYCYHWKVMRLRTAVSHRSAVLMLWPLLILVFFSIPASKLPGYIVPVFPPLALLVASYIVTAWQTGKQRGVCIGMIAWMVIALMAALILLIVPHWVTLPTISEIATSTYLGAGVLIVTLALFSFFWRKRLLWGLLIAMGCGVGVINAIVIALLPSLPINTVEPLAKIVLPQIQPQDQVVSYQRYFEGVPLYLARQVSVVGPWNNPTAILSRDGWPRMLYLGLLQNPAARQWLITDNEFWAQWCQGTQRIWVFAYQTSLPDFTAHHCPMSVAAQHNRMMVVVNR